MPEEARQAPAEGKPVERHHGHFLIPAGVLIGLGVGLIFNQAGAGVLVGLGLGFLGTALIPVPAREEPAPAPAHGPRWVLLVIGVFLVLVGLSIVSGIYLPWTYIIAAILILIGLAFIARSFGWMR